MVEQIGEKYLLKSREYGLPGTLKLLVEHKIYEVAGDVTEEIILVLPEIAKKLDCPSK